MWGAGPTAPDLPHRAAGFPYTRSGLQGKAIMLSKYIHKRYKDRDSVLCTHYERTASSKIKNICIMHKEYKYLFKNSKK
jgi:hypothetical protein